jgi:hypothetical protein
MAARCTAALVRPRPGRHIVAVKKALIDVGAKGRLALFAANTVPATATGLRQELQAVVQFAKANNSALAAEVYETAGAP